MNDAEKIRKIPKSKKKNPEKQKNTTPKNSKKIKNELRKFLENYQKNPRKTH